MIKLFHLYGFNVQILLRIFILLRPDSFYKNVLNPIVCILILYVLEVTE